MRTASEVDERWRDLADRPASSAHRIRTVQLSVETSQGNLLAAVDHEGYRHLLVPMPSGLRVRPGLDGPVLRLRKRPLEDEKVYQAYADLGCFRHDLDHVFTGLCGDVLDEYRSSESNSAVRNPLKPLYRVLDRWQSLFRSRKAPLGPDQLAGLFGELTVLSRLLRGDPGAHRLWTGPKGHRHDFSTGLHALEVKITTGNEALRIRVHGLRQLEAPTGGSLQLACLRLERALAPSAGTSIVDLVRRCLELCDDERALMSALADAGYHLADAEHYRDIAHVVSEERWYSVGDDFPRLTVSDLAAAHVPVTVTDVDYTVDLTTEPPAPLPASRVETLLIELLERAE